MKSSNREMRVRVKYEYVSKNKFEKYVLVRTHFKVITSVITSL